MFVFFPQFIYFQDELVFCVKKYNRKSCQFVKEALSGGQVIFPTKHLQELSLKKAKQQHFL